MWYSASHVSHKMICLLSSSCQHTQQPLTGQKGLQARALQSEWPALGVLCGSSPASRSWNANHDAPMMR